MYLCYMYACMCFMCFMCECMKVFMCVFMLYVCMYLFYVHDSDEEYAYIHTYIQELEHSRQLRSLSGIHKHIHTCTHTYIQELEHSRQLEVLVWDAYIYTYIHIHTYLHTGIGTFTPA